MKRLSILFLGTLGLVGWVRPAVLNSAKQVTQPAARLDYMTFEVAGETKVLRDGEELKLVVGDIFKVKDAFLVDKQQRPTDVNVVGFSHDNPRTRATDDRGQQVDTALLAAKPQWSEGGAGQVFGVAARSGNQLHGAVYVRLLEPALRFAEIMVNGKPRTMRNGELLTLRRSDQFKVQRLVTNLQDDRNVTFQVVQQVAARSGVAIQPDQYEIRFLRSGRKFATIPLKVTD